MMALQAAVLAAIFAAMVATTRISTIEADIPPLDIGVVHQSRLEVSRDSILNSSIHKIVSLLNTLRNTCSASSLVFITGISLHNFPPRYLTDTIASRYIEKLIGLLIVCN